MVVVVEVLVVEVEEVEPSWAGQLQVELPLRTEAPVHCREWSIKVVKEEQAIGLIKHLQSEQ